MNPSSPPDQPSTPMLGGSGVTHLDALPVGTRLHEFEIQGLVGVGGFGMVYRAYDHSLQRTVAIKEYLPVALVGRSPSLAVTMRSSIEGANFAAGLESFLAEARLLARFDHPSLVKVYRYWEANATAYMAMPLYQGVTLKQARTQMDHPPPEHWLRALLWSVLQALRVLHHGETLHRDISPDNIFLQDDGPPVLLDLGSARRAMLERSQQQTAILKVNYAPIEQFAGAGSMRQGPWTDIYALGCVVHALLCNEAPVPATTRLVDDTLAPMDRVARTVQQHFGMTYSPELMDAVTHALALQPGQRPPSVEAWAEEMGLTHPGDMSAFDWRAALREPAVVPAHAAGDEYTDTQFVGTRFAETVIADSDAITVAPRPVRKPAVARASAHHGQAQTPSAQAAHAPRPRWFNWTAGAALALLVLTVLAYLWQRYDADNDPARVPGPALSVVPRPAAPALPALVPTSGVAAPASAVPVEAASVAAPMPMATASMVPPVRRASAPTRTASRTPTQPATTTQTSNPSATAPDATPGAQPLALPERPAPQPAPVAQQRGASAVRDLCAQASFLARPMCLYEECQKRENANLPVCVENRQQLRKGQRDPNNL